MITDQGLHSDLPIPPGEYLAEVIDELNMSQAELAKRMGRPAQALNEVIKGLKAITPETALQLEQVTGVPAHIWTGLEEEYQLTKARQEENERLFQESSQIDPKLYKALESLNCVRKVKDKLAKVRELWRFFGVASLDNLSEIKTYSVAFRVSQKGDISPLALAAWLRCGELAAAEIDTQAFDEKKLRKSLPEIKRLIGKNPEEFISKIRTGLAESGVALVLFPHLPKSRAQGATFWVSPDKVVIQLSIRGKFADIFWFSFFHELGHILLRHGKRHVFIRDGIAKDEKTNAMERDADSFASEILISPRYYNTFVAEGNYSVTNIRVFAETISVPPGIVVGRLQHDGYIAPNQLNHLRTLYDWKS